MEATTISDMEEYYDPDSMKFIIPEAEYSGEEIIEQKTKKRLWFEQSFVWSLLLVPVIVATVFALASPTWEGKLAWSGWGLAIFIGFFAIIIESARGGLAGKFVLLTETYKQLDDYQEQRKIEEIHLVCAPENELDITKFQKAYEKQIEKFILEAEILVDLEGKIAMGMVDNFEKDGYVVLSPTEYQRLAEPIAELNKKVERIQKDLLDVQVLEIEEETSNIPLDSLNRLKGRLRRSYKNIMRRFSPAHKLLKRANEIQDSLMLRTKPSTPNKQKIMTKVEEYLRDRYEGYIKG